MHIKRQINEIIVDMILIFILILVSIVTLYPFMYVLSMSVSEPYAVIGQRVRFLPIGFSFESYKIVFQNKELWLAYLNTLWYAVAGTLLNIIMTMTGAYPLSRKDFFARSFFSVYIAVTMFFSGGLIPYFILIRDLQLYNTRWAIIIPAAVSAWNLIIARVYIQSSIPDSLIEASRIDGSSELRTLLRIVFPLSKPLIAVISLFTAIGFWNTYFNALLLLPNSKLQPLQVFLARVLIQGSTDIAKADVSSTVEQAMYLMQIKYSVIIVVVLPIICVYPFLQKYFVKGVMIGAIKE